jgi:hypothetical protein
LTSRVDEQQNEIKALQEQLQQFDQTLSQCCTNFEQSKTSGSVNGDLPKLEQNLPNPFNENTLIRFYLPFSAGRATIKIFALDGTELKSFDIHHSGYGEVMLNAHEFTAGVYAYTLIIDGNAIDTKQMILTK